MALIFICTKSLAFVWCKATCSSFFVYSNPRASKNKSLLFCRIIFIIKKFFLKKMVFFLSFFFLSSIKKGKYTLNSIVLQNLLQHLFNYSIAMYFMNFACIFTIFLLQRKEMYALLPKPGPRPWTQTLKNLDFKKLGPRKTWCRKKIVRWHNIIY